MSEGRPTSSVSALSAPTTLECQDFAVQILKRLQTLREQAYFPDVRLVTGDSHVFPAHKIILAANSDYFYEAFLHHATVAVKGEEKAGSSAVAENKKSNADMITLYLHPFDRNLMRKFLDFIYTGELNANEDETRRLFGVSKTYKLFLLEDRLMVSLKKLLVASGALGATLPTVSPNPYMLWAQPLTQQYLSVLRGDVIQFAPSLGQLGVPGMQPISPQQAGLHPAPQATPPALAATAGVIPLPPRKRRYIDPALAAIEGGGAGPRGPPPLIPTGGRGATGLDDKKAGQTLCAKEVGGCRNRQYILKVGDEYQCRLCKKTYQRYNSTSYHVTIYHRNPPIRCDQPGCSFATREARYIHFHKFYRHRIQLPPIIGIDDRQCPFCKHIAKSPSMLDKHLSRHLPECTRDGRLFCSKCQTPMADKPTLLQHMWECHDDSNESNQDGDAGDFEPGRLRTRPPHQQPKQSFSKDKDFKV